MPLIQNACRVAETDTYLVSTSEDDLVSHTLPDGLTLSLSGGLSFARRDGDFIKLSTQDRYEEWCLTTDDPFQWVANHLLTAADATEDGAPIWRPIKEQDVATLRTIMDASGSITDQVATHWCMVKEPISPVS